MPIPPPLRKPSERNRSNTIPTKTQVGPNLSRLTLLGDEGAAEKFKQINRAQEVLLDDQKRQIYDTQGEEEVERYEQ